MNIICNRAKSFLGFFAFALGVAGGLAFAQAALAAQLAISPPGGSILVGETVQFQALDDPNQCSKLSGCPGITNLTSQASWSTSDASVLQSESKGQFKGLKAGAATVTAHYGGQTVQVQVQVKNSASDSDSTNPNNPGFGLQFLKRVWHNPQVGVNGEDRFPWIPFWLNDGYFVVTDGWCTHYSEQGGFKVFREDGTFVADGNTCLDSLAAGENADGLNLWSHQWNSGNTNYAVVDGNSFVIGGMDAGHKYPPKLYSVNLSGVTLDASAWKLKVGSGSSGSGAYNLDDSPAVTGYAVVGNKVVADVDGKTVIYSLPTLSVLDADAGNVVPFADIGDYVIGRSGSRTRAATELYRLSGGNEVEKEESISSSLVTPASTWRGGFQDPLNPNRFAIRENSSGDIHVHTIGNNGATEVEVRKADSAGSASDAGIAQPFALYGEYIVYGKCSSNSGANRTCQLVLDKGGAVATAEFPDGAAKSGISGISVSPNGTVMVVAGGGAYLYKIGQGSTPTDPNAPFPPGNGTSTPPLPQVPGQMFSITPTSTGPATVLTRFANVLSVSENPKSLTISIFGKNYRVDAAASQVLSYGWAPTGLNDFMTTGFANVWGTLDPNDPALIHAIRVRNPIPVAAGMSGQSAATGINPGAGTGLSGVPTGANPATQTQLNVLQQALNALRQRFGQ